MLLINDNCVDYLSDKQCQYDMILTSPPYDDLRTYDNHCPWNENTWKDVIRLCYQSLKSGGVMVWVTADATIKNSETLSSFKQMIYAKDEVGFNIHDTMVWKKSNFSNPSSTRYHQTFEYMFVLSKGKPKTFNPIKDRKNVYAGKAGSYGKNTVTQKNGSKKEREVKINSEYGMRHNVWEIKTSGQTGESREFKHPAMFPLELARDHIQSWSNPGDTILDPFMGSGSTGVVCKELNREFVGIEINKDYYDIAKQRIEGI